MQRLSPTSAILLSVALVVGLVDITDALYGMRHFFTAGPPGPCQDAMNTDDDGELTIADPLSSLFFLFGGHRDPSAPGLNCGVDLTQDALRCFVNSPCGHSMQTSELAGLVPADGCDDVFDQMRENLTNTMERKLDENLQIPLDTLACGGGCCRGLQTTCPAGFSWRTCATRYVCLNPLGGRRFYRCGNYRYKKGCFSQLP